jgi:hypothetical protein
MKGIIEFDEAFFSFFQGDGEKKFIKEGDKAY